MEKGDITGGSLEPDLGRGGIKKLFFRGVCGFIFVDRDTVCTVVMVPLVSWTFIVGGSISTSSSKVTMMSLSMVSISSDSFPFGAIMSTAASL